MFLMLPAFDRVKYCVLWVLMAIGFITAEISESMNIPQYPNPRPRFALASIYQRQHQFDLAVSLYKDVMANPRSEQRYCGDARCRDMAGVNYALILINGGLLDEAEKLLLSIHNIPEAVSNEALIWLLREKPLKALAILDNNHCNAHPGCMVRYGEALEMLVRCREANQAYWLARKLDPDAPKRVCQ